jgi:hypothetical protein
MAGWERLEIGWLERYLIDAMTRNLCTTIHCTTCGAQDFRQGLIKEYSKDRDRPSFATSFIDASKEVARSLSSVSLRDPSQSASLESAIRLILFDLWQALGAVTAEQEIEPILSGTWTGAVLASMKAHHKARQEARRAFEESQDPIRVQQRREEKRRVRQQQHVERMERKKERDRQWRENHPDVGC